MLKCLKGFRMPPKQQNALTCFIHHTLIPDLQRQGRTYPNGMADLIQIALPLYKNLQPHEKARYEEMSRNYKKAKSGSVAAGRRDNVGNIISQRKDPAQIREEKRKTDKADLKLYLPPGDALLDYKFYLIGFEYMVEVITSTPSEYMPVEVGVVEWCMRDGVTNTFHRLINPGDFPLGYRFKCQEHGDETHKIPLDTIKTFETHYAGIWSQLERFIKPQNQDYAVYCMEREFEKIFGCLFWLLKHSGSYDRQIKFRVRFLEDLVQELYSRQGKNIAEASIREMLCTTVFDYDSNTCCQLHEQLECRDCAVGVPKRYTYAMSDGLSVVYAFDLTSKHLPTRDTTTSSYVLTGINNEQLVPEIGREISQLPSAGRGVTIDSDGFGARDIRFHPVGGRYDDGEGSAVGLSRSHSAASTSAGTDYYASSSALRAPAASQVPSPAFQRNGNVSTARGAMSNLSLGDDAKPTSSRAPSANAAISAMLSPVPAASVYPPPSRSANPQVPDDMSSSLSHCSSAPSFGVPSVFPTTVVGRGRGISGPPSAPGSSAVGRGAAPLPTSERSPPGVRVEEQSFRNNIPPGFPGSGRGGTGVNFY